MIKVLKIEVIEVGENAADNINQEDSDIVMKKMKLQ